MKKILGYLSEMTAQPDRQMIDAVLVKAVADVASVATCEMYGISLHQGKQCIWRHACWPPGPVPEIEAADLKTEYDDLSTSFPVLAECIASKEARAMEPLPENRMAIWLPLWGAERKNISGCIRLIAQTSADMKNAATQAANLESVQGMLAVYRNFTQLLEDNEHDSLTGLLNRKTFDRRFTELVGSVGVNAFRGHPYEPQAERRTIANEYEHWLAVIDIDHFKAVNDQFGHVYGDEVLILLANILKTSFRDQDRVYRFGGEEFVVLLRATSLEHARKSFERLRARVETYEFPQIKKITISLGFVRISHDTPVAILGHADQALYYAKEHGRNQVCFYDELLESGQIGSLVTNQAADFF